MRAVKLLLISLCLSVSAVACGQSKDKAPSPSAPMAKIGKDTITYKDISGDVQKQIDQAEARLADAKNQYEQAVYQAKRGAIEKLVNDKIFGPLAKEKGVSVDQFRQMKMKEFADKQPPPTDEEQHALYEQVKASGQPLESFEKVQPQIVEYLKTQKAVPEAEKWYEDLKKQANVQVLLPPYRREVDSKGPAKGPSSAKVTIVEFSDFQCPYCVKAEPTVAKVLADYGDKVRLVYRDFPLEFHQFAPKASQAAHCAEDQGKYWEMHEKLFALQGQLPVEALKKTAREIQGIDGDKFDKCLDSGEKQAVVDDNMKAGKAVGVSGTPAFFINGRPLSGAVPYDEFKKIIDEELASK